MKELVAVLVFGLLLSCRAGGTRAGVELGTDDVSAGASGTDTSTRVVLLGTGTPNAEPDRAGSSLAVVVNGQAYLVDCGPGVVRRAVAASGNGIDALSVEKLTRVFITHLHSDHTLGYPDLIFTPWVLERREPLEAYGPAGLAKMTDHILAAYREDIDVRVDGAEPANADGYKVNVHEVGAGVVYEDANVRVTAFPVRHGDWRQAFGYRFEAADRTVVVSGDTSPCASLVLHAKGCDVLVHEVYSQAGFERRMPVWQRYHSAAHTSTVELAKIARQVQPGLLVLTHQLLWGATPEQMLAEIGESYDGEVRYGRDLDVY